MPIEFPLLLVALLTGCDESERTTLEKSDIDNSNDMQKKLLYPIKDSFQVSCVATEPDKSGSYLAQHSTFRFDPIDQKLYGYAHISDDKSDYEVSCRFDEEDVIDTTQPSTFCGKSAEYCAGQIDALELTYEDALTICSRALSSCPKEDSVNISLANSNPDGRLCEPPTSK